MKQFYRKKLKEIKWWAWLATVGPMFALSGLFFSHMLGFDTWYTTLMTVGAMGFFLAAVIWWWWAIWTIARITVSLGETSEKFDTVHDEIQQIKKDVKQALDP